MVLFFMGLALLTECLSIGIESTERSHNVLISCTKMLPLSTQRGSIGRLFRTKAPVAPTMIGRTDGTAAGMSDGAETWRTMGNHYTYCSVSLAIHTDTIWWSVRLASVQESTEYLHKLMFVDGATAQFKVNRHVVGDRC